MASQTFILDDTLGYDFDLIAIHGSLEPYYVAFLLNKHLRYRFERSREDLIVYYKEVEALFARYDYYDRYQDVHYYMMANKVKVENQGEDGGLFNNHKSTSTAHFISERPRVDYFIKVMEDGYAFAKAKTKILHTLNQIPQIVTAYEVEVDQLKNKQNLIFE